MPRRRHPPRRPGCPSIRRGPRRRAHRPSPPRPFLSRLGRPLKVLLGIASLWPMIYFFVFMAFFFVQFFSVFSRQFAAPQPTDPFATFHLFRTFFLFQFLTIFAMFALMALYVVDVFRSDRVAPDRRVLWLVVLLMGGTVAMPVYWYLHVWREPERAPPPYLRKGDSLPGKHQA